jgi:hypothetical protein
MSLGAYRVHSHFTSSLYTSARQLLRLHVGNEAPIQPATEIEVVRGTNALGVHIWGGVVKKKKGVILVDFRIRVTGAGLRILHIW